MRIKLLLVLVLLLVSASFVLAQEGVRKRAKRPHEYGNVVMNSFSERNNISPVVFNHWLHRSYYTCRLCHVDLGFGMSAGSTGVREDDNEAGLYCGACHDGKEAFGSKVVDKMGNVTKNCFKCHSYGKKVKFEKDFYEFTRGFPKARFGDKLNWLLTEERGLVKLKDFLEGHSIETEPLKQTKSISIKSKELGLPDIIFSHEKHTVWNGCEVCHPDIFGIKKGSTVYSMQDIFEGKYCGSCHGNVAFPNDDCQLCHTKAVY